MNEIDFLTGEISRRFGTVRRARGCFLYTAKNVRLTDMYQEAGRAILGWGGGAAFTVLKNVLSRGLTGSFATDFTHRMDRAAGELLFSTRIVYAFRTKAEAVAAGIALSPEHTSVWRPWAQGDFSWSDADCVIIEPPLPWTEGIFLLAVKVSADEAEGRHRIAAVFAGRHVPVRLPAVLEAAAARALYDMIAAIQQRSEKDWFIYDSVLTKYWERRGPYLYPKVPRGNYESFLLHCLDEGIVISPVYEQPSIVPFGADKGVFSALVKNPFTL